MRFLRGKLWSPWDIACLKWCCLLLGMIAGARFAQLTRRFELILALVAALLAIRVAVAYFRDDGRSARPPRT